MTNIEIETHTHGQTDRQTDTGYFLYRPTYIYLVEHKDTPVLKHRVMKTYGRVEIKLHGLLTSASHIGKVVRLILMSLYPSTNHPSPGNIWIGGWVGLRAGLDAVAKRKKPFLAPATCRIPVFQTVAYSL